jgi:hypothetical protein
VSGVRTGTGCVKGSGPAELDCAVSLCTLTFVKDFFFPLHFVTLFLFSFFLGWIFGLLGRTKRGKKRKRKKKVYENNNSFPLFWSLFTTTKGVHVCRVI